MSKKSAELLTCPFCASKNIDPEGWMSCEPDGSDKKTGPACDDCGASASSIEQWNTRLAAAPCPDRHMQIFKLLFENLDLSDETKMELSERGNLHAVAAAILVTSPAGDT